MKLKFLSVFLSAGSLLLSISSLQAQTTPKENMDPRAEADAKTFIKQVLRDHGLKNEDVQAILKDPHDPRGSVVCQTCIKAEQYIDDPDTTCGGHTNSITCGYYVANSLYNYIKSGKACTPADKNEASICALPGVSLIEGYLQQYCPEFKCS